jgi:ribose transport system substrate-binding protein
MKKYRNAALIAALGGVLALSLAACSTGAATPSATSNIKLAYVYGNATDPFWTSTQCGAQAEAKKLGVTLNVFSIPDLDATKFQQALDAALIKNPTGLLVNPLTPNQFIAQYKEEMAAGVPVIAKVPVLQAATSRTS